MDSCGLPSYYTRVVSYYIMFTSHARMSDIRELTISGNRALYTCDDIIFDMSLS